VHHSGSRLLPTLALLTVGSLAAAGDPATVVVFSGPTMGTRYTVRVAGPPLDDAGRDAIQLAIEAELTLADRLLSTWNPESEISRLNRHASSDPFEVSPETAEVLAVALAVGELSGGAFDVTVGPLVEAWGFGPGGRPPSTPSPEELAELKARVGPGQIVLDRERDRVVKARPDVECDLSALAPGWTADRISAALLALGHPDHIVDIGGEVVTRGHRADGTRWRVAVESPGRPREAGLVIALQDTAVATSGDYRNAWVDEEGRRRSHLIDPRTGQPVEHGLASVTVVHEKGIMADALATALLVMGPEDAWALASRLGLAVRLVARNPDGSYSAATTSQFEGLVWTPPAD
jgi:thiamine biosynthesis lipoprotein